MDIQYGKPANSVKRFSRFKWVTAAVLLALSLLAWLGGPGRMATTSSGGSDGGPIGTSLAIERTGDGGLKVLGTVPDEATRDQWLNAIRIGAQGARVTDDVRIDAVTPATDWGGQLSSLVAVMRELKLAGIKVDGARVILSGEVGTSSEKADAERMVQAQLPSGYDLDSRLAVAGSAVPGGKAAAGAKAAPPASVASAPAAASAPDASSAASPANPSGSGSVSVPPTAAAPTGSPSATASPGSRPGAAGDAAPKSTADSAARTDSTVQESHPSSKSPARKPVNCPRRIRSLAQSVYFKTDAATISSEDRARLERLGACLGRASLRIVGHTDPRHTDEYNLELSQRRARSVADALVAGGAPSSRITVVAAGKTKPSAKGASREALQRSRRVDIQIR